MTPPPADLPPIERLRAIMAGLRAPDGCPWDREQTLESLRPYLLEEAYEVLEAIDSGDPAQHCDELGDLLLQVVFQSQLRAEDDDFDFDDVATAIADKLVRRHPHVFGDTEAETPDEVVRNWEAIKRRERGAEPAARSAIDGVSDGLPALMKAQEYQRKAAKAGFDWTEVDQAAAKLDEELAEFRAAGSDERRVEELADLVFAAVNVIRHLGGHAETSVNAAAAKFRRRFQAMENLARERGLAWERMDLAAMDRLWDEVKRN